uniref:Uncharacterized protein n=1 Tax=Papilio xuthus TaxID=66420 RepID=I4DJE8_PAPXU|nr:uncharacterized protein LOC106122278 precursor [Papilio xuthus]BAM18038.1 unknown secreted protein [Papilio xuthus]
MSSMLLLVVLLWGGSRSAVAVNDDLSKYWTKDFKEVLHLYGKTSDKDLYGESLPPSMTYKAATTQRSEIILEHTGNYETSDFDQSGSTYPYFNQKKYKQSLKPAQSVNYFSYSESNAAKQNNDQLNNKYLNQTPQQENQNIDVSSKINLQGFQPYFNRENDYTRIQNILSTERNIGTGIVIPEDNRIYRNKARNKVREYKVNTFDSRTKCPPTICRKLSKTAKRIYSRPVKKIKRIVVY